MTVHGKVLPLTIERAEQVYPFLKEHKAETGGQTPTGHVRKERLRSSTASLVHRYLAYLQSQGRIVGEKCHTGLRIPGGTWLPPKEEK